MSAQFYLETTREPLQVRHSAQYTPDKSHKLLNRNTTYNHPPPSYTNRISCPTRQAFYKNMEDEKKFCYNHRTTCNQRNVSQPKCPKHDLLGKPRTRNTTTKNRNNSNVNYTGRSPLQKHVNISSSYLNQEQNVFRVENSLPTLRKQPSFIGDPSRSRCLSTKRPVSMEQGTRSYNRVKKQASNFNANVSASSHPVYEMGSNKYRNPTRASSSSHYKCTHTSGGTAQYRRPRTPSYHFACSSRAGTPEHPHHFDPERELPYYFPRVQTPVFIVPPTSRRKPQYLTKSKILHVDIEPLKIRHWSHRQVSPEYNRKKTYRTQGFPKYDAKDVGYDRYHNESSSPHRSPAPKRSVASRIPPSSVISRTSKTRAVSPIKTELNCPFLKKTDQFNNTSTRNSRDNKKPCELQRYSSPPVCSKQKKNVKRPVLSESDRNLSTRRKANSAVTVNKRSFFDGLLKAPSSDFQSCCSPVCNSIWKSPLSTRSSYKTISPEFFMSFNPDTRISVPSPLPAMSETQSQTTENN